MAYSGATHRLIRNRGFERKQTAVARDSLKGSTRRWLQLLLGWLVAWSQCKPVMISMHTSILTEGWIQELYRVSHDLTGHPVQFRRKVHGGVKACVPEAGPGAAGIRKTPSNQICINK